MFNLQKLVRKNILNLIPYSSARDEFQGKASVFLDANENPFGGGVNRYPDPLQNELRKEISKLKGVAGVQIFLGNGSDEAIDLLFRAFCIPGTDNVVAIKPSYGMYKVCADINDIEYKEVLLGKDYHLDIGALLQQSNENSKLVFLCSPNNPTGNSLSIEAIKQLLRQFNGLVVVDEAYIDFSKQKSILELLPKYPNLVVLQTFSKAWGLAGIRLGMAFASEEIIKLLNAIKYPYNVNSLTQEMALAKLKSEKDVSKQVDDIIEERGKLVEQLGRLEIVSKVYPSDANFLLVKMDNPLAVYNYLMENQIIVRDRSRVALCEGCLRITIGTKVENEKLLATLRAYQN